MATLVFTAVGTALGGPLGGALGGLLGRQVDQSLLGSSSREGPRLRELSVTSSSYGQPIPRIFGRMRVGGTVIWSTELVESSDTSGGKGQPKTTTYSYSASFAVALSSTPIQRIGRIWADGNLLRGASEDLKVEGHLRVYRGLGDQPVDPLIAADKGSGAIAFRDCAYVVFEDLHLTDFGNRIPTLTFEVFASETSEVSFRDILPEASPYGSSMLIPYARGFADEGGPVSSSLSMVQRVLPLICTVSGTELEIGARTSPPGDVAVLPERLSINYAQEASELFKQRGERPEREPVALRYYDEDRDYQPGVQRATGSARAGRELMIELPATMTAEGAKQLANSNANQASWKSERVVWRVGEINPSVRPGVTVRLPSTPGLWQVLSWEWFERGIELTLERVAPELSSTVAADPGIANPPSDVVTPPTVLSALEVPPDGSEHSDTPLIYAAASAQTSAWAGAALYVEQAGNLVSLGTTSSRRSVTGQLAQALAPSGCTIFESRSQVVLSGVGDGLTFENCSMTGLANGANRLCVGDEILQFLSAVETGPGEWTLEGLLRGRAGTEDAAISGHLVGTFAVLLNDRLVKLDPLQVASDPATRIAAIGRGDTEPAYGDLQNAGLSRRPPMPVHACAERLADGSYKLAWTRRARGQWRWDTLFEIPLIEQAERYIVGYGPVDAPHRNWDVLQPNLTLGEVELADLAATYGSAPFWVRQIGTFAQSPPLQIPFSS